MTQVLIGFILFFYYRSSTYTFIYVAIVLVYTIVIV
jgi:hypothetical protein